jgi:uncharacterized protein YeaC (DUF1315 family)
VRKRRREVSIITLPKNTGPDSCQDAQQKFDEALGDSFAAVMIIMGEGPDIDEIITICTQAADVKPSTRKVVWVPDLTVLTQEQKEKCIQSVVVIGLDKNVAATLTKDQAKLDIYVEEAFTKGEAQGPNPQG